MVPLVPRSCTPCSYPTRRRRPGGRPACLLGPCVKLARSDFEGVSSTESTVRAGTVARCFANKIMSAVQNETAGGAPFNTPSPSLQHRDGCHLQCDDHAGRAW